MRFATTLCDKSRDADDAPISPTGTIQPNESQFDYRRRSNRDRSQASCDTVMPVPHGRCSTCGLREDLAAVGHFPSAVDATEAPLRRNSFEEC
jgi:hypothetical protein